MKVISIVLFIMFSTSISLYGQNESEAVDSTFENYMQKTWAEIRESDYSESLQNRYSKEFYDYYLENPDTKTGSVAIRNSFMMWSNTGNSEYFKDVVESLDDDSEIWKLILFSFRGIYRNNDNLEEHELKELLQYLSVQLSEPIGKSEAILILLRLRENEFNKDELVELAFQLVEINATEYHVDQGFGYLQEFLSFNISQKWPGNYLLSGLSGFKDFMTGYKRETVLITDFATDIEPYSVVIKESSVFSRYRWYLAAGGLVVAASALMLLTSSDDDVPHRIPIPPGRP